MDHNDGVEERGAGVTVIYQEHINGELFTEKKNNDNKIL